MFRAFCCGMMLLLGTHLVAAQDDAGTKPSDVRPASADKLEELSKEVATLRGQVADSVQTLKRLADQLERITDLSNEVRNNNSELIRLRDRLENLELDVSRLRTQQNQPRRSFAIDPAPLRGNIRLENTFSMPMSVIVDGVIYTLQPGETRFVERTAGTFTYEVPGVQTSLVRTLTAGETFVIRIYPR